MAVKRHITSLSKPIIMKRILFITTIIAGLCSCGDSSPNISNNKDTVAPQGTTESTPNNPGGLQSVGGGTTTTGTNTGASNTGGGDTANRMNNTNRDSTKQ
jgi:hypothetical protein